MADIFDDESPRGQDEAAAYTDDDDETGLVPAIPAATLVVFADADDGPARLLMLKRAETMRFAAGATVFPGGRVDADDAIVALTATGAGDLHPADAAARVAAIRETLEETGLPIGLSRGGAPLTDGQLIDDLRVALHAGEVFSGLLQVIGLDLDVTDLTPFTRWRPNFAHSRVFDTRFYLATAPRLTGLALAVNTAESSALFWSDAQSVLQGAETGDHHIIFPTRRNLERLAQYADFAQAIESARRFAPRRITPFVREFDGEQYLCIRNDCGYPVLREPLGKAMSG